MLGVSKRMGFVRGVIRPGTTLFIYPILESGSTVLLLLILLLLLCYAQETPPGFCNEVDWRALFKD